MKLMGRGIPTYEHLPVHRRPSSLTPLSVWLRQHGVTVYAVARALSTHPGTVKSWSNGQVLPSLIGAFKLEQFTAGGVPAASWLGTELAKLTWQHCRFNWANWYTQVDAAQKRYLARKAAAKRSATDGSSAGRNSKETDAASGDGEGPLNSGGSNKGVLSLPDGAPAS